MALDIREGDEVIVPAITFVATANCVLFRGATPVFADVEPDTLLANVQDINCKITSKTKAIIGVDYAGQPADWPALKTIVLPIQDSAGCRFMSFTRRNIWRQTQLANWPISAVFQPTRSRRLRLVKGVLSPATMRNYAARIRSFRNHGISTTPLERESQGAWHYEMQELGYNYRLSDIQCALGNFPT